MKKTIILFSLFGTISFGQLPYTENLYQTSVQQDIVYGQSTNYAGQTEVLELDLYKPIGDTNCSRPCLILVHGGAWIAGSKNDVNIVNIAQHYAEKGWVVAAINYRLGTHKTGSHDMYLFCNDVISAPCGYIADSAEIYRANYRGQQDAKGVIRFMKNRNELDSIDVNNVFIAGANAPNPDADLVSCLPVGYSLMRPDLGDVQGELNLGVHDASVQGVGNIYGAMLNFDMLADETDWPVVYQFHQGSDVVVNYDYGRVLGRMDWECYAQTNLCQSYAQYPRAYGSKGIETYFLGLVDAPERVTEIVENYEYLNDCFDNGHSIDNWVTRANNMADLFAIRIEENGNTPNTGPCFMGLSSSELNVQVFPNPSNGTINLQHNENQLVTVYVYSSAGDIVHEQAFSSQLTLQLTPGVYYLKIYLDSSFSTKKIVVL
jgi:Secretion system C-terminal sorting domain/Carboxylesterase family